MGYPRLVQKPGKSGRERGLVDMSSSLPKYSYKRPTGAVLEVDQDLQIDENHRVHMCQWFYKEKIVDFALMHRVQVNDADGDVVAEPGEGDDMLELVEGEAEVSLRENERDVVRYDCRHSQVHKHQFFRKRSKKPERSVYREIDDPNTAWQTVDESFEPCYDDIVGNYEAHLRRWQE